MDAEKKKALEEKLLRLFENQEPKVVAKKTIHAGVGNVIRRRKGQPDKRLGLDNQNA